MKAVVLGLGVSGKSAKKFLEKRGWTVVCIDDKLSSQTPPNLAEFDLFVPSPGVPRSHPLYKKAIELKLPIKGEAQLGLEGIRQICIGITGTNGKTTTVRLIEHCLNYAGIGAKAVGNVGFPLTGYEGDDILIVELSSFQLETVDAKVFDLGVILNITPDHLDRYASQQEYAEAKIRLQHCVKEGGELLIHQTIDSSLFQKPSQVFVEDPAWEVCKRVGVDEETYISAKKTFVKPPHRMEFVTQLGGVDFINDSKATNVDAVLHALKTVGGRVLLIAGGLDKGLSFEPLQNVKKQLSGVIVFGQAREKIANALQHLVEVHRVETVSEAVCLAKDLAKAGESVLFSPGCASFDAYKNYEERGEEFKKLVRRRTE